MIRTRLFLFVAFALSLGGLGASSCSEKQAGRPADFSCPAQNSREACLAALAGDYSGTIEGGGTWKVVVDSSGHVSSGSLVDAAGATHTLYGTMDADGRMVLYGDFGGFDGQVRVDGSVWGLWTDGEWLRGFSGTRQQGAIRVGTVPTGDGGLEADSGTLALASCVSSADCPTGLTCNTGQRYCAPPCASEAQCPSRCDCTTGKLTLSAVCSLSTRSCELLGGAISSCVACAGSLAATSSTQASGACYLHCAGNLLSNCIAMTSGSQDACNRQAGGLCGASDAGVTQSAFVAGCQCPASALADTPACAPTWYARKAACYYRCAAGTGSFCSNNIDNAACVEAAARQCTVFDAGVSTREIVAGCSCTDTGCAPDWY